MKNNSRTGLYTIHAQERSIERKISDDEIRFVLRYGEVYETRCGRLAFWFNMRAADRCPLPWSSKKNAFYVAVIQASDGVVVTTLHTVVKKQEWQSPQDLYRIA